MSDTIITAPLFTDEFGNVVESWGLLSEAASVAMLKSPDGKGAVPNDLSNEGLATSNSIRAARGARVLLSYAREHEPGEQFIEFRSALTDLLADLTHLADALDLDWDALDRKRILDHYEETVGWE